MMIFFLTGFLHDAYAQTYPLQVTTQLAPPYSVKLSDYASATTDRIAFNVFADISRPNLQVRFRLTIEGQNVTVTTRPEYNPPPVTIQGGVPERFTGYDLMEYFNPANLNFQGITRQQFMKTGSLPEGFYRFKLEVLEYNRGIQISNTGTANAWLILNDPPIVNLPRHDEKLKPQSPQNVLIQWTPRHTGSPNSAFTTEYEVTMVEVWPSTRNPNDAILSSPPIFQATTQSTTLIYGVAETPLELGRRYAFRVQAKSMVGVEEMDLFKNKGYSEVVSFVYGDACDLPTGIRAESLNHTRFDVSWEENFNHTAYKVRYRLAGDNTAQWYENNTVVNESSISSLKPNTTYEYQVAAVCGLFDGPYSTVSTITTKEAPPVEYSCGIPMEVFSLDPESLATSLKVGDVIQAGDFDVELVKVSGSNGVFSGEGVMRVSFLKKAMVKAEFTNITVNKELRMVNGAMNITGAAVEVVPQGLKDAMDKLDEALDAIDSTLTNIEENLPESFDPNSFVADTLIKVKDGISDVYKDADGTVVIVDKNGNKQQVPAGTTAAVIDDAGNGYLVDKKGNVHKTTADIATKAANREFNLLLKFASNDNAHYGFDVKKHESLTGYETLDNGYKVAWKSVASNSSDVVTAKLTGATDLDTRKIHFEMGGVTLQASPAISNDQSTNVALTGKVDGMEEGLIAVYAASDTGKVQVLGKVNVVTYDEIQKTVVIVPVNGTEYPYSITSLRDSLNRIYGQAVVKWSVESADGVDGVSIGSPFDDGETGLLSNYTSDMRKVINAYKDDMDDDKVYLFLIGGSSKNNKSLAGYMPRSKQAGFIFIDQAGNEKQLVRAIAHELGHGAFNLAHTFKEERFPLPEKTTDNLMDYAGGQKLYKFQWDKMRYPDIVIGIFEEDEDSKYTFADLTVFKDLKNADDTYTFLSPGGKPVTLPKTTQGVILTDVYHFNNDDRNADVSSYPLGTLIQFDLKMEDGTIKTYGGVSDGDYNNFVGYRDDKRVLYQDTYTAKLTSHEVIIGYPCLQNKVIDFYAYKIDVDKVDRSSWPSQEELSGIYDASGTYEEATGLLNDLAELELLNYSGVNPIVKGPISVGASANSASIAGLDLNNEEVMTFLEDVGNCGTIIQNNVLQVLNIIALNPGAYTAMRKCERYALVTKQEYQSKYARGHGHWYPRFVQGVRDALVKKIETHREILKSVDAVGDPDDFEDLLSRLCEEEYKMFSAKQRINILETLAKGELEDCWFAGGTNTYGAAVIMQEKRCAEAQVIYTLKYTPAEQYKDLVNELKNRGSLLIDLIEGLDNIGPGGSNFDRLALELYGVWHNSATTEVTDELLEQNKILNYKENFITEELRSFGIDYSSSSSYTFLFEPVNGQYKITPAVRVTSRTSVTQPNVPTTPVPIADTQPIDGAKSIYVGPLDDILVRFESDMKFPGEDFVIFPQSTEPYKIPALLLYWLIEANNNKRTMRDVMTTLNVAMMVVAGAEMATARGIRLVFATLDFLANATFATLPAIRKEVAELVRKNELDGVWLEVLDSYQNLVKCYAFFRAGQATVLLFRAGILKMISYKNVIARLREDLQGKNLTELTRKGLNDLLTTIDQIDGSMPLPPPSGPVSPLFKGISSVDKEILGLSPVRINTPGFQNNGFSGFVRAAKTGGGYEDVMVKLSNANYASGGISSGTAEMFIKSGVATLPKVYPAGVKIIQNISVPVVEAADASVATAAVQASTAPKMATAQIMLTADGPVITIATDAASAASPSLLPQILYAAPGVLTKVLEKIKEENTCEVCKNRIQVCHIFEQIRNKAMSAGMGRSSAKDAVDKICESVTGDITLAGIAAKINNMQAVNVKLFLEDVLGTYNITNAPNNNYAISNNVSNLYPRLIDGWLECKNARPRSPQTGLTRLDVAILRLAGEDTGNAEFMSALTIRGENKYRKLLKVYVGPCNTCPAPPDSIAPAKLPMMDVYLAAFEQFVKQYSSKKNDGLDDFISGEATADYSTKQDGAYHLIRHLNSISVSAVSGFEKTISQNVSAPVCRDCRCDVLMRDGTMVDYKSYLKKSTSSIYGSQFKQYIQRWAPGRSFKYIFNEQKVSRNDARLQFYNAFKNHAPDLITLNPRFFARYSYQNVPVNADNIDDFMDSIDHTHPMFEFVEVN